MSEALRLATIAGERDEVPIGAVVVSDGEIVGTGWNRPIELNDPTAHAEILALRSAARRLGNYRLPASTLFVTVEPCVMCVGAMVHARIRRVVYGAAEPKFGALGGSIDVLSATHHNHHFEVAGGVLRDQCADLIKSFFVQKRQAAT